MNEQQMIDFGYMFLNGNLDDFMSNKSISDEQKKQFIELASNSKDCQMYLIQEATKKQKLLAEQVGSQSKSNQVFAQSSGQELMDSRDSKGAKNGSTKPSQSEEGKDDSQLDSADESYEDELDEEMEEEYDDQEISGDASLS